MSGEWSLRGRIFPSVVSPATASACHCFGRLVCCWLRVQSTGPPVLSRTLCGHIKGRDTLCPLSRGALVAGVADVYLPGCCVMRKLVCLMSWGISSVGMQFWESDCGVTLAGWCAGMMEVDASLSSIVLSSRCRLLLRCEVCYGQMQCRISAYVIMRCQAGCFISRMMLILLPA